MRGMWGEHVGSAAVQGVPGLAPMCTCGVFWLVVQHAMLDGWLLSKDHARGLAFHHMPPTGHDGRQEERAASGPAGQRRLTHLPSLHCGWMCNFVQLMRSGPWSCKSVECARGMEYL